MTTLVPRGPPYPRRVEHDAPGVTIIAELPISPKRIQRARTTTPATLQVDPSAFVVMIASRSRSITRRSTRQIPFSIHTASGTPVTFTYAGPRSIPMLLISQARLPAHTFAPSLWLRGGNLRRKLHRELPAPPQSFNLRLASPIRSSRSRVTLHSPSCATGPPSPHRRPATTFQNVAG